MISWIACTLVERHLGVSDAPDNVRKLQSAAVPTSGGLGFAVATVCGAVLVFLLARPDRVSDAGWVLAAAGAAMWLGAADDRKPLSANLKLLALVLIGGALVLTGVRVDVFELWPGLAVSLPVFAAAAGSLVWLIVVANAVNFMDGANGLSMGMGAIAATGLAVCGALIGEWGIASMAAALGGALCGFLVLNAPGRLFAGDAGALFVGVMLAGLGLLLVRAEPSLLLVPPLLLSPFLVDVLMTLIWRARQGRPWREPHRDHAYQIALKANMSHGKVALIHAIWAFNSAAVAVVATMAGSYAPTVAAILLILGGVWVHRMLRRLGERSGLLEEDGAPAVDG